MTHTYPDVHHKSIELPLCSINTDLLSSMTDLYYKYLANIVLYLAITRLLITSSKSVLYLAYFQ